MLRRNILIFHTGALGDFVLTLPLAAALGRIFAQSRVIYVTHGQKGKLAERVLGIESCDVETGWHHLLGDPSQLPERPAKLLAGAQVMISIQALGDSPFDEALVRAAPDAMLVPIRTPAREQMTQHMSDLMIDQLAPFPVIQKSLEQMLRSVAERGLGPAATASGGVVIHPGSSRPAKCWPIGKFVELAARLRDQGNAVRVLLGEVELERWKGTDIEALGAVADLRRPETLLDLWQEISSAKSFIGNDSGPAHLAGIIGKPTLALFGPTDSAIWRPLGPRVKVLQANELSDLSVDAVLTAISD